jgi:uncharacterized protein (DUF433 family)
MLSSPAHPLIGIDPEVRFGRPCIAGTHISVRDVMNRLNSGWSVADITEDFLELTAETIVAAQAYTADSVRSYATFEPPDFRVTYRLFTAEEGGRKTSAHQHIRWDFCYEDKDMPRGRFMIFPEFLDPDGYIIPNGPFSPIGQANMFIARSDRRAFHRQYIQPGTRGFFMEGFPAGVCEVVEVLGLR